METRVGPESRVRLRICDSIRETTSLSLSSFPKGIQGRHHRLEELGRVADLVRVG